MPVIWLTEEKIEVSVRIANVTGRGEITRVLGFAPIIGLTGEKMR